VKKILSFAVSGLRALNAAVIRNWAYCLFLFALAMVIVAIVGDVQSSKAPITFRSDCGLILDVDDIGPDSRTSKVRTDKMIAITNLRLSSSIPAGSRLYYVERVGGWKGWLIE